MTTMQIGLCASAIAIALLVTILILIGRGMRASDMQVKPMPLMDGNQILFFERLTQAVDEFGPFGVYPQIPLSRILKTQDQRQKSMTDVLRMIVADFVVIDAEGRPVCLIDYDRTPAGMEPDPAMMALAASADIPLIQFRYGRRSTVEDILLALQPSIDRHVRSHGRIMKDPVEEGTSELQTAQEA